MSPAKCWARTHSGSGHHRITLPVTKHNFLINKTEEIAPAIRYAFQIAKTGRPGPVLVDITKDAQQGTAIFDFDAAEPACPVAPIHVDVEEHDLAQALN